MREDITAQSIDRVALRLPWVYPADAPPVLNTQCVSSPHSRAPWSIDVLGFLCVLTMSLPGPFAFVDWLAMSIFEIPFDPLPSPSLADCGVSIAVICNPGETVVHYPSGLHFSQVRALGRLVVVTGRGIGQG